MIGFPTSSLILIGSKSVSSFSYYMMFLITIRMQIASTVNVLSDLRKIDCELMFASVSAPSTRRIVQSLIS